MMEIRNTREIIIGLAPKILYLEFLRIFYIIR